MGQELSIDLVINDSQAKRMQQANFIGLNKLVASGFKFADAAEKAAKRAADAHERAAQKTAASARKYADDQIRSLQRIADANEKAARKAVEVNEKAARKAAESREKAAQRSAASEQRAAQQVERAEQKAYERSQRNADRLAEKRSQAAQRSADAAIKSAERAAEAQARAEQKAADASIKAALKISEAKRRAALKAVEDARKAGEAMIAADQRAADQRVKTEADRIARLERLGRQHLSKEEVQLRARAIANQKLQQGRVDAAAKAMAGDKDSGGGLQGLLATGAKFAGAFVGVSLVKSTFGALGDEIQRTRKKSIDYAESLLDLKNDLKEIAVLKGSAFADDNTVKDLVDFSKATGLSIAKSTEFQNQLYGSSAGGLQKGFVDDETLKKTALLTGKAAARQTDDLSTRGDVVGLLTQLHDYKHDAAGKEISSDRASKAIAADMEAVRLGLTEGRGKDSELSKSFANVAGSLAGDNMPVPSAPKLASLIGVMSLSAGPGMADTRAEQYVRGLRGETPAQMEFMKTFTGRNEHDDLEVQADKFHKAMEKVKASGRDQQEFLVESGVNAEQSKALIEGDRNYDILKKRFRTAENPLSAAKIEADNAAFAASPAGRKALGDAELKAAELAKGKEMENLEAEKPAARAELVKEGMGTSLSYAPGNLLRWIGSGFTVSGEDSRVEERAAQRLRKQAGEPDQSGMDTFLNYSTLGLWGGARSATGGYNQDVNKAQEMIDLQRQQLEAQKAQAEEQRKTNEALARMAPQGKAPTPLAASPPGGMQRPNAGP